MRLLRTPNHFRYLLHDFAPHLTAAQGQISLLEACFGRLTGQRHLGTVLAISRASNASWLIDPQSKRLDRANLIRGSEGGFSRNKILMRRLTIMDTRRTLSSSIFAAALLALCLPAVASAQWPDNARNRDQNNGRYGRYDERNLRDSINRLDRLAKNFEKDLDRALDRSRRDGTRREDRVNGQAREFRNAVSSLKSRFGNGRDLNRSRNEAQRVLQEARQLERAARLDNRTASQWSQIQQELRVIANAYGSNGYDDGSYGNGNRRRNTTNDPWYRRIPSQY